MKRGRGSPKITLVAKEDSWSFIWVEDLVWEALFGDLEFFTVMFDVARGRDLVRWQVSFTKSDNSGRLIPRNSPKQIMSKAAYHDLSKTPAKNGSFVH